MIKKISKTDRILSGKMRDKKPEYTELPAPPRPLWGEKLARNLALSGMILLTVVSVRSAQLPSGRTVLTAVQSLIDPSWDDQLGKISFVSSFFPETVSVFFDSPPAGALTAPCSGSLSHAWTAQEPYLSFQAQDGRVYAAAKGQVMSLSHGPEEEIILRLRHEELGLETVYYNLAEVRVREGDPVEASTCLGTALPGKDAAFEVRRAGRAIDPAAFLQQRSEEK